MKRFNFFSNRFSKMCRLKRFNPVFEQMFEFVHFETFQPRFEQAFEKMRSIYPLGGKFEKRIYESGKNWGDLPPRG